MNCLNLGCGNRFHPEWTNLDFQYSGKGVFVCDLSAGIPFPSESFDVVYHSHLIEHFSKSAALVFMKECYRVLKAGGVIRVATPDFELLAKTYLDVLEDLGAINPNRDADYQWTTLHMLDQLVRERPGGEIKEYLTREQVTNMEFVSNLMGSEAHRIRDCSRKTVTGRIADVKEKEGLLHLFIMAFQHIRAKKFIRNTLLKLLLGKEYETLQIGRFRQGGEIHKWLYDRYSLQRLMQAAGWKETRVVSATESSIPDWNLFHLDTESNGIIYRPDSIFVEGLK